MLHGFLRSEGCGDVAANDSVNRAVDCGPKELPVAINLAEFWKSGDVMKQDVCAERNNDYDDETGDHGENAARDACAA